MLEFYQCEHILPVERDMSFYGGISNIFGNSQKPSFNKNITRLAFIKSNSIDPAQIIQICFIGNDF